MDDFREWLSDNLRYFMLGGAILIVVLVLFFGIRACLKAINGKSGSSQETTVEENTADDVSSADENVQNESNPLEKDAYPQINALIKDYYSALSNKDIEKLRSLVDNLSLADETKIEDANTYIERYDVKEVYTKKGMTGDDKVVYVYYEYYCTGISTPVPALSQMYVKVESEDTFYIVGAIQNDETLSSYMNTVKEDSDVQELISKVRTEYEKAQEENPELKEYLQNLGDEGTDSENTLEESAGDILTATTICNVRAEADEESEILGTLSEGEQVEKTGQEGEWVQIEFQGQTAYVFGTLLQ